MPQPKPRWRVLHVTRPLSVLAPLALVALALHPLSSPYKVTPLSPSPDAPAPNLVLSSTPPSSPSATVTPFPWPTPTPAIPSYVPPVGIPVATAYPAPLPSRATTRHGLNNPPPRGYQVGAYYFSGWAHGPNDNLSPLLTASPLRRYEPLIGWYDDSQHQVDQSIDQAANAGLTFFAFDWYDLDRSPYETDRRLNDGLRFYLSSPKRTRLKFCIQFVDQAPFLPRARDWPVLVRTWLRYFAQPDYVRVGGKPLFIVFSPENMRLIFGSSANVRRALDYLRVQARRHGLPGVTIAVGITVAPHGNPANYGRLVPEGYDVTTGYNYHHVGGEPHRVPIPYNRLVQNNEAMWDRVATHLPQPYIPVITLGWDQRFSAREQETALVYTGRTPAAFTCYAAAARQWIDTHPQRTVRERIVLIYAWNEIGEGGALIPNRTDGYAYTNAVRRVFGAPGQQPDLGPCQ
jgi:Glycosyltransferase WbsX